MSRARQKGAEIADEERDDSRLTGLKDELILLEGQESTEDGGKRLKTATVEGDPLKQKEEVNQMVTHNKVFVGNPVFESKQCLIFQLNVFDKDRGC